MSWQDVSLEVLGAFDASGLPSSTTRGLDLPVDYWIDAANGDDSNDGLTEETAWASLSKANIYVPGGQTRTVRVKTGSYSSSINRSIDTNAWLNLVFEPGCTVSGLGSSVNGLNFSGPGAGAVYGNGLVLTGPGGAGQDGLILGGTVTIKAYDVISENWNNNFRNLTSSSLNLYGCVSRDAFSFGYSDATTADCRIENCQFLDSRLGDVSDSGSGTLTQIDVGATAPDERLYPGDSWKVRTAEGEAIATVSLSTLGGHTIEAAVNGQPGVANAPRIEVDLPSAPDELWGYQILDDGIVAAWSATAELWLMSGSNGQLRHNTSNGVTVYNGSAFIGTDPVSVLDHDDAPHFVAGLLSPTGNEQVVVDEAFAVGDSDTRATSSAVTLFPGTSGASPARLTAFGFINVTARNGASDDDVREALIRETSRLVVPVLGLLPGLVQEEVVCAGHGLGMGMGMGIGG